MRWVPILGVVCLMNLAGCCNGPRGDITTEPEFWDLSDYQPGKVFRTKVVLCISRVYGRANLTTSVASGVECEGFLRDPKKHSNLIGKVDGPVEPGTRIAVYKIFRYCSGPDSGNQILPYGVILTGPYRGTVVALFSVSDYTYSRPLGSVPYSDKEYLEPE